ncbi:MAG: fimbria/pilus periplasmic chaperone [Sphingopyxis sp.]|nr:fimbria/pilus periplasmic chaperone [Sphingopyxis sp.]
MRSVWLSLALLLAALVLMIFTPGPASAQQLGAVLIWPVNPVIEADKQASALWLENPGKTPVTLQVRIYAWAQTGGKNVYADQQTIIGTPPIVTIAPGSKQLVRLTRSGAAPSEVEKPYRVIIDEIPVESAAAPTPGAAISFRMRYSLPLFVLGGPTLARDGKGSKALPVSPDLSWRVVTESDDRILEVSNRGVVHARLTDALLGTTPLAEGLLGYVLPGETMRWPLPASARTADAFEASVNGAPRAPINPQPD